MNEEAHKTNNINDKKNEKKLHDKLSEDYKINLINHLVMKENIIRDKSFKFALKIISLCKELYRLKEFVISRQLLRSGISIGANVEESIGSQTTKDFINKLAIALKEARETKYWLALLSESQTGLLKYGPYIQDAEDIVRILTSSIKTLKGKTSTRMKN